MENKGTLLQIIGPVIDARFEEKLPAIYNALIIKFEDGRQLVVFFFSSRRRHTR